MIKLKQKSIGLKEKLGKLSLKLRRVWENKFKIISGFLNLIFRKYDIELIAEERLTICRSCPYYDKYGTSDAAFGNGGGESCSICGCLLEVKTRAPECSCALEDIDEKPLWKNIK